MPVKRLLPHLVRKIQPSLVIYLNIVVIFGLVDYRAAKCSSLTSVINIHPGE